MRRLKGWLILALLRATSILPLAAARALARAAAAAALTLDVRAARTTRINVALCFPELGPEEQARLVRDSLAHSASVVTEAGPLYHWPRARWQTRLTLVGDELFNEAMASGRGVLLLGPHFGNWEALPLFLGRYAVTGLYDPPRISALEKTVRAARERNGMRLLPIDARGLRGVYQALSAGSAAGILPDQVPGRNAGVYAPFFGHPALTMTLAHRLIRRTRPVVLLVAARRVSGGFRIEFHAAPPDILAPDPETSAAAMNSAIESLVRTDPSQYQWEYKRFRRQPAGVADPYRVG
ncbi:MAG TPA: lysophospholipid acyltransferase family protein [Pseudomonadales bacterium]